MKKTQLALRHIVLALSALAFVVPAAQVSAGNSWTSENVKGNGSIKKQARELGHFTGVSFGLPGTMEIRLGNTESVTIETDDNLLPMIETVVDDGTLRVRAVKRNTNFDTRTLKFIVTTKQLERLSLGGSGTVDADVMRGGKMHVDIGGSGNINVKGIEGDTVSVSVGGSGNLKAGPGSAKRLSVSIAGSGDVSMGQVKAGEASVSIAGSGNATIAVRDNLSASIVGSGDVEYYGDPKVSKTVMGSGSARKIGDSK
jgi:hypothetical protein